MTRWPIRAAVGRKVLKARRSVASTVGATSSGRSARFTSVPIASSTAGVALPIGTWNGLNSPNSPRMVTSIGSGVRCATATESMLMQLPTPLLCISSTPFCAAEPGAEELGDALFLGGEGDDAHAVVGEAAADQARMAGIRHQRDLADAVFLQEVVDAVRPASAASGMRVLGRCRGRTSRAGTGMARRVRSGASVPDHIAPPGATPPLRRNAVAWDRPTAPGGSGHGTATHHHAGGGAPAPSERGGEHRAAERRRPPLPRHGRDRPRILADVALRRRAHAGLRPLGGARRGAFALLPVRQRDAGGGEHPCHRGHGGAGADRAAARRHRRPAGAGLVAARDAGVPARRRRLAPGAPARRSAHPRDQRGARRGAGPRRAALGH